MHYRMVSTITEAYLQGAKNIVQRGGSEHNSVLSEERSVQQIS